MNGKEGLFYVKLFVCCRKRKAGFSKKSFLMRGGTGKTEKKGLKRKMFLKQ